MVICNVMMRDPLMFLDVFVTCKLGGVRRRRNIRKTHCRNSVHKPFNLSAPEKWPELLITPATNSKADKDFPFSVESV